MSGELCEHRLPIQTLVLNRKVSYLQTPLGDGASPYMGGLIRICKSPRLKAENVRTANLYLIHIESSSYTDSIIRQQ